ncbi:guanylate-binding protein 2-like [Chrysemys picta bellii]|uniref:guanylate-binding protein 2-like n=1 Tax=Chrysemys picta bellii TaxID=8478 RepID=UPI0032B2627A
MGRASLCDLQGELQLPAPYPPCPAPLQWGPTLPPCDFPPLSSPQGDAKNDVWIFTLAVLLSGTLVYNSLGTIDQRALEQLHYVTELTEHIKVKVAGEGGRQKGEDSAEFVHFFPALVWAVRDFTLQLELDGREITEDEYLENALKRRQGQPEKLDLPKKYLRQYFPSRKCFVFDRPAPRCDLARLDELPEAALSPDFLEPAQRFCSHIHQHAGTKTLPGGHVVTGTCEWGSGRGSWGRIGAWPSGDGVSQGQGMGIGTHIGGRGSGVEHVLSGAVDRGCQCRRREVGASQAGVCAAGSGQDRGCWPGQGAAGRLEESRASMGKAWVEGGCP